MLPCRSTVPENLNKNKTPNTWHKRIAYSQYFPKAKGEISCVFLLTTLTSVFIAFKIGFFIP